MALSDEDRAALRAHWLGELLPPRLVTALECKPRGARARRRQQELRRYQHRLSAEMARQTRRLILTYSPAAVARLVELMRGESAETARRAAVDLLRHYESSARQEQDEAAAGAALEDRRLADNLSDGQVRDLLAILADAGAARAEGTDEEADEEADEGAGEAADEEGGDEDRDL